MQASGNYPSSLTSSAAAPYIADTSARFRLTNGTTAGPRPQLWGQHASSRMTQGVVTADVDVAKALYDTRRANNDLYGADRRISSVADENDLNIHEHELVMAVKNRGAGYSGTSTYGFTSFNGIPTGGYMTQDDFEDNLRYIGRAKIPYYFNSVDQGSQGVSTQVRGAHSTANRGAHAFEVGDRIRWHAPNIDARKRADEKREFHYAQGMPERKELVHLSPVTYADLHMMPQRAYAAYLAASRAQGGDENVRTRQSSAATHTQHASRLVRFAIAYMRAASLAKLLAGLAVLAEKKAIAFLVGTKGPADAADYQAAAKALAVPLGKTSTLSADSANALATFGHLFDLAPARTRDTHLRPAAQGIADMLEAMFRGLAPDNSVEATRLKMSRFTKGAVGGAQIGEVLDRMQVNAVRRETYCFAETKEREDEKIIGVALSRSNPGEILDFYQ